MQLIKSALGLYIIQVGVSVNYTLESSTKVFARTISVPGNESKQMAPVGPNDEEEEEEEATLVRANRAIESAERRCHFWCDAKTLQWQLKVITRAINAATAAATATAKKTHRQPSRPRVAATKNGQKEKPPRCKKSKGSNTKKKTNTKNARNLFVINWLAINQTITKMLSTLRHVNTNTNTSTNARTNTNTNTNTNTFAAEPP